MLLDLEEIFIVGQDTFFDSISPTNSFGVTFEDDLTTGYFYAVDTQPDLQILDALHVYNVADVIDKDKPSKIQITWSDDGEIASLLINNYYHAIFTLKKKPDIVETDFQKAMVSGHKFKQECLPTN